MNFNIRIFEQFNIPSLPKIIFARLDFDYCDVSETDFKNHGVFYPDFLKTCVSKRKAEYLAGRLCAKKLFEFVGHATSGFQLIPQSNGLPTWPNQWLGSISHTHDSAVVGITNHSDYNNLGLDLECIMENDTARSIASQVLTKDELSQFLSTLDFKMLLTLIFSIKESIYKALYSEIMEIFDFDAFTVTDIDLQNSRFEAKLNYNLNQKYSKGFTLSGNFILCFGEDKVFSVVAK